jgi:hypothetical protein
MPPSTPHIDTLVALADRDIDTDPDIAPPIHQTATFAAESDSEFVAMASTARHPRYYTRDGNPTTQRAEAIVAALEGAESALLTSSGMGAISTTLLSLLACGDHVIAQKTHYMGATQLLETLLPRLGIEVTLVDQTSIGTGLHRQHENPGPSRQLRWIRIPCDPTCGHVGGFHRRGEGQRSRHPNRPHPLLGGPGAPRRPRRRPRARVISVMISGLHEGHATHPDPNARPPSRRERARAGNNSTDKFWSHHPDRVKTGPTSSERTHR